MRFVPNKLFNNIDFESVNNESQIIKFNGDEIYKAFSVDMIPTYNKEHRTDTYFIYTPNHNNHINNKNEIKISLKFPIYAKRKISIKRHRKLSREQIEILMVKFNEFNNKITYLTNWQYALHMFNVICNTADLEYKNQSSPEVIEAITKGAYIPLKYPMPNYLMLLDD